MQFLPMSKIKYKFLGPYRITARSRPNRFEVVKAGQCEGPIKSNTGADLMKKWKSDETSEEDAVSETDSV